MLAGLFLLKILATEKNVGIGRNLRRRCFRLVEWIDFGDIFPERRRRSLHRNHIPQDLNLLRGDGIVPGVGLSSLEGFRKRTRFFPKEVALLAYLFQIDRPRDPELPNLGLAARVLNVGEDEYLPIVCAPDLRIGHSLKFSAVWALTLTLYRMSGNSTHAISDVFQIHESDAMSIINYTLDCIRRFRPFLKVQTHPNLDVVFLQRLPIFTAAINKRTHTADEHLIYGFVDGSESEHSVPSRRIINALLNGRFFSFGRPRDPTYSFKKFHCMRYLLANDPSGHIFHVTDLYVGRLPDVSLQGSSEIQDFHVVRNKETQRFSIRYGDNELLTAEMIPEIAETHTSSRMYGDKGFFRTGRILPASRDDRDRDFNTVMKSVRVSVEHMIGRVYILWKFLRYGYCIKLFNGRQDTYMTVAHLLTNVHNMLHPNQVSQYFDVAPMSIYDYFDRFAGCSKRQ